MRIHLTTLVSTLVIATAIPAIALAAECVHDISPEQQEFLNQQNLEIKVPEAEVAVVQRCDTNGDQVVDITDIRNIVTARNQPAAHADDPMDWDGNNVINVLDARGCQQSCAQPRCAPMSTQTARSALVSSNTPILGGATEETACSKSMDLDGDESEDFVGIFENTGEELAGGYNLKLVFVNKDENGMMQQTTIDYAGEVVEENGQMQLKLHIREQAPGEVDLAPGKVNLENPGIVTYSHGIPEVIYYWVDGELRRGAFFVDD